MPFWPFVDGPAVIIPRVATLGSVLVGVALLVFLLVT